MAAGQVVRNRTYFANLIWDVNRAFRVGLETTWRKTAYRELLNAEGAAVQTLVRNF